MNRIALASTFLVWTAIGAVIFFISSVAVFFASGEAVWFFGNPFNPLVRFSFIALGVLALVLMICTGIALRVLGYRKSVAFPPWKDTLSLILIAVPIFIAIITLLSFGDLDKVF